MTRRRLLAGVVLLGLLSLGWRNRPAFAGLYDNDKAKVTQGDVKDIDYWNTKWNMERLEEAIQSHQPEGAIAVEVGSLVRNLDDLLKTYPNHEGIKTWRARAGAVQDKLDPNANRSESFREGCLWAEGNYRLAYATFGAGKMAVADKDWESAHDWLKMASENLGFLEDRLKKQDRVANWPPEFVAWIKAIRPELNTLRAEVAKHLK
jgi:hypothetical protein